MAIQMIMQDPTPKDTVKAVINTLNQVEVRGKTNMDRLLGSIIALEKLLAALDKPEETE